METIKHIHHISAIVEDAQENLDFYRDVLQLRLVKKHLILMTQVFIISISLTKPQIPEL